MLDSEIDELDIISDFFMNIDLVEVSHFLTLKNYILLSIKYKV